MPASNRSHLLALAITFAATAAMLGACGGPAQPADSPTASGGDPATADGGGDGDGSSGGGDSSGSATPAAAPKVSIPLSSSKMLGDIEKLGLDPKKLPTMDKMKLGKKKKIMPLLQKALGMENCEGCHLEDDKKAKTRNTRIAEKMWDEYVVKMRDDKGGALFCDSCHAGNTKVLARDDKDVVSKFMEDHYEAKITQADGEDTSCSTCHDSEIETAIIEKLWKIK